eukprot:TRINITY_DN8289_c0_g1_i1.p1 TRINITY_DN8289_c0_g1~~TRINITY_DN8289_c0_g1_i1.p1  ORF type:complete len:435 (-),score=62.43 TRINITY_DN8289_c0_g1_i1:23-1267(-)
MAMHRWTDGRTCSKLTCGKMLSCDDEAVIIATNQKILARASAGDNARRSVSWTHNGRCALHKSCWLSVLELSRSSSRAMASNEKKMIESASKTVEYLDSIPDLSAKAKKVASLIANSSRVVAFTGAGISTSAGINDYRGTAGLDTKESLGQADTAGSATDPDGQDQSDFDYTRLQPTPAHRALVQLHHHHGLTYVATQNCDDLHGKAGLPRSALSDLHGNVFVEYCDRCGKEYHRAEAVDVYSTDCHKERYYEECERCHWGHYTGHRCEVKSCKGKLRDTIVNFGDLLHDKVCGGLPRAIEHCQKADVILALGTSLQVHPANDLPQMGGKLIICNLQETDFDDKAAVRVFATCDDFLTLVLAELQKTAPAAAAANVSHMSTATISTADSETDDKKRVAKEATNTRRSKRGRVAE